MVVKEYSKVIINAEKIGRFSILDVDEINYRRELIDQRGIDIKILYSIKSLEKLGRLGTKIDIERY